MQQEQKATAYRRLLFDLFDPVEKYQGRLEEYPVPQPLIEAINRAVGRLRTEERAAVRYRWGLDDGIKRSRSKTAEFIYNSTTDTYGVSGERVRQLGARALRKLRHPNGSKQIVEAMEDTSIVSDYLMDWIKRPEPPSLIEALRKALNA